MAIAAPAADTAATTDEPTRTTLFAPGGPLNAANPHDPPGRRAPSVDGAPGSAMAADLFSTQTRDHEEGSPAPCDATDPDDGPGVPHVDLRDGNPTLELMDTMATATEAIEYVERARGHLYTLHHLLVRADILFAEVAASLQAQGRADEAELLQDHVIGRNVIDDRWSFELVEGFDDSYYSPVTEAVRDLEGRTVGGRRHARESVLKQHRTESADAAPDPRD